MTTPGQGLAPPTRRKGCADIIGFGDKGVYVVRNSMNLSPHRVIDDFGYSAGNWRTEKHLRLVADLTGNGPGDIVGFGNSGVIISINNNDNTFQKSKLVLKDFGYDAGGWRIDKHPRFLFDLRRTGRADIIGFGNAGVYVSKNSGNGHFSSASLALNNFGYNQNWRVDKHIRVLGDSNADGCPDIIGFGESATYLSMNNRDGTFGQPKKISDTFCYSKGWRVDKHPRCVADLTGDRRVDLVGFGDAGVYVALNTSSGVFQKAKLAIEDFGYNKGWRVDRHPRFVADLTGDGRGDIIGFGNAGVYVSYNNGDGTFKAPKLVIKDFGYDAGGWRVDKHPRFVADLTGDGRADIVGFGNAGIYVAFNNGKGEFSPVQRIVNDMGYDAGGWRVEKHVRYPANLYV
ncbi:hypothetical protein AX16_007200 [Volvariella volvacea WC 439]|nr:hypothetical protein AX16_007200 [Volvariella volvacea WC 439]